MISGGRTVIDLNADLGEGAGTDAQLLAVITSANIACGVHAGDPVLIRHTVQLARTYEVGIGAHPSFPDREGFGRRPMALPRAKMTQVVADQIRVLTEAAHQAGERLQHVKAHGALYNLAAADADLASAIGEAVCQVDRTLIVVALAGSQMVEVLRAMDLRVAEEAFIDRGYTSAGTLVRRSDPRALITDVAAAAARAVRLARDRLVTAVDGEDVPVEADTFCVHGDTPNAVALAQATRRALEHSGISVRPMGTFL